MLEQSLEMGHQCEFMGCIGSALKKKCSASSRGSLQFGHVLKLMKSCFSIESSVHLVSFIFLEDGYGLLCFLQGKVCSSRFYQNICVGLVLNVSASDKSSNIFSESISQSNG